jgi:hypothetical protein
MLKNTRSPLKDKPLRNPGQSLDEKMQDFLTEKIMQPVMMVLFFGLYAALEWYRYFFPSPPQPVLMTIIVFCILAYSGFQLRGSIKEYRQLKLGRDGEKIVGQFLDDLRSMGYRVFHDIVGDGFNIDHVLVGPAGVFTIETKTHSKPVGSNAKVCFDGERITVGGFEPDRNPVVQAKAQANWLRALLVESTGEKLPIRPVILFPGWWVEQQGGNSTRDLWVLEPKAIRGFLEHQPVALEGDKISMTASHLMRFIRVREREAT